MKSLGKQTTLEDIANMETIRTEIAKLVGSAPSTLDTLAELASAIQSNQTVVEALDSAIGSKADNSTVTALATRVTNLENSATKVSFTQTQTSGTKIGAISIDGTSTNIYAPTIPTALKNPNALTFGSKTYDGSAAKTITASDLGLGSVSNLAASDYLTALSSNTTNAVSITVGGTTKSISVATMKTSLGLKALAYKDSVAWGEITGRTYGSISLNGSSSTFVTASGDADAKSFFAPVTAGTSGYWLKSNGSGQAPTWATMDSLKTALGLGSNAYTNDAHLPTAGGTITGNLRLKGDTDYGNYIYFGNSAYCYLNEDSDNHLRIYASKGINLVAGSGYSVTINGSTPLFTHQSIYALTIKNSIGTTQVTYTPNSEAESITLTKAMVGLGNVENTALSSWTGSTNIVRVGTIIAGTWQGTKISNTYLANNSMTIAGESVSLGGSITTATLRKAIMGSTALGGTSAYLYWTGTAWGTKTLGALAFEDSIDLSGYLLKTGGTISGALTVSGLLTASSGIKIGSATLSWDSTAGALKVDKPLYSTGDISAKGTAEESETQYGPLMIKKVPVAGTYTDSQMESTYGLTSAAIDGLLGGLYTKVVFGGSSVSRVYSYEAYQTSIGNRPITIVLSNIAASATKYKLYKASATATTWTITEIS